jgi:hypothetical protein
MVNNGHDWPKLLTVLVRPLYNIIMSNNEYSAQYIVLPQAVLEPSITNSIDMIASRISGVLNSQFRVYDENNAVQMSSRFLRISGELITPNDGTLENSMIITYPNLIQRAVGRVRGINSSTLPAAVCLTMYHRIG